VLDVDIRIVAEKAVTFAITALLYVQTYTLPLKVLEPYFTEYADIRCTN
jgi:hypothetical protein